MQIDPKKLQLAMARNCISIKNLAEKSGITTQTIIKVQCGRKVRPETAGLLAKALGVDPSEIIKEE